MAIYMVKVTFTLDDDTVRTLRQSAQRLGRPQSAVVREAIADHARRIDRLSEEEKGRMLAALARLRSHAPGRTDAETDAELRDIRRARRAAGQHRSRRLR